MPNVSLNLVSVKYDTALPASKVLKYLRIFIHINFLLSQHLLVFFYM